MSTQIHTQNYNAVHALKSKIVHNLWFLVILLIPVCQTVAQSITVSGCSSDANGDYIIGDSVNGKNTYVHVNNSYYKDDYNCNSISSLRFCERDIRLLPGLDYFFKWTGTEWQWYSATRTGGCKWSGTRCEKNNTPTETLLATHSTNSAIPPTTGWVAVGGGCAPTIVHNPIRIFYVTQYGAGTKDGSSWANASNNIQAMINQSIADDKIFIASGIYKPEYRADAVTGSKTPDDRDNAFVLKPGIQLYGGFVGTETTEDNRTNIMGANKTILSGDIGVVNDVADNTYHVVIAPKGIFTFNGFVVTKGYSTGSSGAISVSGVSIERPSGGGMYCRATGTLSNTIFIQNTASLHGGGMYNNASTLKINQAIFAYNSSGSQGPGICNEHFTLELTNAVFIRNTTNSGFGAYTNNDRSNGSIYNSVFWDNPKDIFTYSSSQPLDLGNNLTGTDPKFVDADNNDFRLLSSSPAIDAGDNTKIAAGVTTDINGDPRQYNSSTVDMGAYEYQDKLNTWQGTTTDWATSTNWSKGVVPTTNQDVYIPSGLATYPVINNGTNVEVAGVVVKTGANFTLNTGATLKVANPGSGNLTYNITPTDTNKWHLISAPLKASFTPSTMALGNIVDESTTSDNIALATYSNSPDSNGEWNYYQKTNTDAQTFVAGKGYSVNFDTGATTGMPFAGTHASIPTQMPISIAQSGTAQENRWNLVGNPYPMHLNVSQFLTDNMAVLSPTHLSTYVWNPTTGTYEDVGTGQLSIGQAFFVNAKNASGDAVIFTDNARTTTIPSTLYKNNTPTITLLANETPTRIQFLSNATNGLDPGLDIGSFTGTSTSFDIYSHLVENYQDVHFMRQSVPLTTIENTVIPIGLIADAGTTVNFSIDTKNISNTIKVYLEDKVTGIFTELSDTKFEVVLTEDISEVGRFYLHTSSKALSTTKTNIVTGVHVLKTGNQLLVSGLKSKGNMQLFSIRGKQVLKALVDAKVVNSIELPKLAKGVYIVRVNSVEGILSKKVMVD